MKKTNSVDILVDVNMRQAKEASKRFLDSSGAILESDNSALWENTRGTLPAGVGDGFARWNNKNVAFAGMASGIRPDASQRVKSYIAQAEAERTLARGLIIMAFVSWMCIMFFALSVFDVLLHVISSLSHVLFILAIVKANKGWGEL